MRKWIVAILAMTCASVFPLLLIEVLLWFFPVATSTGAMPLNDSNPVMRYTPNQEYVFSKGWNFEIVNYGRINNYGFVNEQDYTRHTADDGPIVIIGDSYVEAMMVPYEQTVQGRLSRNLTSHRAVYSVATSGSQLADYLQYAKFAGDEFHPYAMVFVIVGNDFDESLARYRSGSGYHFECVEGTTSVFRTVRTDYNPSRMKRFMRHSALVRYLWTTVGVGHLSRLASRESGQYVGNTDASASPERVEHSRSAVDFFLSELPHRANLPPSRILFVIDAARPEVYSSGPQPEGTSYFHVMRQYLMTKAAGFGYEAIDMHPWFHARHRSDGARFEFAIDGHWNGLGHEEASKAIAASQTFKRLGID